MCYLNWLFHFFSKSTIALCLLSLTTNLSLACSVDDWQRLDGEFFQKRSSLYFRMQKEVIGIESRVVDRTVEMLVTHERPVSFGYVFDLNSLVGKKAEVACNIDNCHGPSYMGDLTAIYLPNDDVNIEQSHWRACRYCGLLQSGGDNWFGLFAKEASPMASQYFKWSNRGNLDVGREQKITKGYDELIANCKHSWHKLNTLKGWSGKPPFIFTCKKEFDIQTSYIRLLIDLYGLAASKGHPREIYSEQDFAKAAKIMARRLRTHASSTSGEMIVDLTHRRIWECPWFDHFGMQRFAFPSRLKPTVQWLLDNPR